MTGLRIAAIACLALAAEAQTVFGPGRIGAVQINGRATEPGTGEFRIPISAEAEGQRLSGTVTLTFPLTIAGGTASPLASGRGLIALTEPLRVAVVIDAAFSYPASPAASFSISGSAQIRTSDVPACNNLLAPAQVANPASAGAQPITLSRQCSFTSIGTGAETGEGISGLVQGTVQINAGRTSVNIAMSVNYDWRPATPSDSLTLEVPQPASGTPLVEEQTGAFTARVRAQLGTVPRADLFLVLTDASGSRVAQAPGTTLARGPASSQTLTITPPPLQPGDYSLAAVLTEPGTTNIIKESDRLSYTVHRFRLIPGFRSAESFVATIPELRASIFETSAGNPVTARIETSLPAGQLPVEIYGTLTELNGAVATQVFGGGTFEQFTGAGIDLARETTAGYESIELHARTAVSLPGGGQAIVRSNRVRIELDALRIVSSIPGASTRLARGQENRLAVELDYKAINPSRLIARVLDRTLPSRFQISELEASVTGKRRAAYSFTLPAALAAEEDRIEVEFALEQSGGGALDPLRAKAGPLLFPFQEPLTVTPDGLRGRGVLLSVALSPPPAVARTNVLPLALTAIAPATFALSRDKGERGALSEQDASRVLPMGATWEFEPQLPADRFQGRITLSYAGLELPAEPGLDESKIEIVSVTEAGDVTRWPSEVDAGNKSVSAEVRGLARYWMLAAFGPFATRPLALPVSTRSWLLNLGTAPTPEGLPSRVLTPADSRAAVNRASSRTVTGVGVLTGESAGFETLAAEEPPAGPLIAPLVRPTASIHALNPESLGQEVLFVLFRQDGSEQARRRENLAAGQRRSWSVSTLFENLPADFAGSLWLFPERRLAAAIVELNDADIAAAPLVRPSATRTVQYSSLAAATSFLDLVNVNRVEAALVTLRWRAPGGAELGSATRSIAPGAMLRETIGSLFGGNSAAGSLSVESAPGSVFGWIEVPGATFVPLEPARRYAVAPVLTAAPGESSVSIFNPGTAPAQVEIATRQDTATSDTRRVTIPAGGTIAETVRNGNYLLINASGPVVPQLLLRASGGLAFAAAQTPADGVEIPPALDAPTTTTPRISITPLSLDFGTVVAGQNRSLNVTISNPGTAPLVISSATFSNAAFTSTATLPVTVAPSGTAAIAVRFAPAAAGAVAARVEFVSNDPATPRVTVNLTGTGSAPPANAPRIEPSRPSVDFGTVSPGSQNTQPLQVRNTGNAVLEISSLTIADSRFTLVGVGVPISIQPQSSVSWTVRLAPGPNTGAIASTLTVTSNDPATPSLRIALTATVSGVAIAPRLTLSQTTIDFGAIQVGQQGEQTIEIRNTGNAELEVESMRTTSDRYKVPGATSFKLPPGVIFDLRVTYAPTAPGEERAILRILSNDPASPTEIPLTGSGR